MNLQLAQALVATLPVNEPNLFNPWRSSCTHQSADNGPEARLMRLAAHLDRQPLFLCIGEAPGYAGCRYSGVAFTSERLLMAGEIPGIARTGRLSDRKLPFSEPSATIVWKALKALDLADKVILWNAVQLHPHRPGELWSNRTPKPSEIALGSPALRLLTEAFPKAKLVAIGQKASGLLSSMGFEVVACVRHPANGGAKEFACGMEALAKHAT